MARLYARIAGFALYRWGGEYTWVTTGPVSSGVSEPLPLPTTIIGAVLGTSNTDLENVSEEEVLEALGERFGCRVESLRGPYYPTGSGGLAIHVYPGRLLVLEVSGNTTQIASKSPLVARTTATLRGTAVRLDTKSVVRGMLYATSLVDAASLEAVNVDGGIRPEVSMDILGCGECRFSSTRKMGGDMRVARIACEPRGVVERLLEGDGSVEHCIVASPVLLEERDKIENLLRGSYAELDGCRVKPLTRRELEELAGSSKELLKALRLRVAILSPGVHGSTGFPRKPFIALMPGTPLRCECSRDTLRRGLGAYSRLGFGTLIPLAPQRQD